MRLVRADRYAPAEALATDEALVRVRPAEPVLHLWRTAPAVVVGRFQRVDWEIDPAACGSRGVRAWRRFTGGGAVYLDEGVVCAELALPRDHPWASLGIPGLYAPLLDGLVRACRSLGVPAERDERTVRVHGRKVTGIAAHRGAAGTVVHGTLLVSADLDALEACLAGPRGGELGGHPRPAPSRPDRVANIGRDAVEEAIAAAFDARESPLADGEPQSAARLMDERYDDPAWHAGPWLDVTPAAVLAVLGGDYAARRHRAGERGVDERAREGLHLPDRGHLGR